MSADGSARPARPRGRPLWCCRTTGSSSSASRWSRNWLSDRPGFPLDALAIRTVDTGRGVGRVLRAAVDPLAEADTAGEAEICAKLFALALIGALRVRPPERRGPDLLLPAIRQLIRRRLGEHGPTPADGGRELGCSASTLHRHCQMAGRSFGATLWEEGVAVERLVLWRGLEDTVIPTGTIASPGWHASEGDVRWTGGAAGLDLPTAASPTTLDVDVAATMSYDRTVPAACPARAA